jgi:hypothetical protein
MVASFWTGDGADQQFAVSGYVVGAGCRIGHSRITVTSRRACPQRSVPDMPGHFFARFALFSAEIRLFRFAI